MFYFLFSFLCLHKKHKNTNKRISYSPPLICFLSVFFIFVCLFAFLCFCFVAFLCFLCFWCFWCFLVLFGAFWCVRNLFVKNNKKFKTALITSFILLLRSCQSKFIYSCTSSFMQPFITNSIKPTQ